MTFTRANYGELASDPETYKGARVKIVGKVFVVERTGDTLAIQMYADPKNDDWATIVGTHDTTINVAQDDYVRVVGTVRGKFTGKNGFGGEITDPLIDADSIDHVSPLAAASPALYADGRMVVSQYGITVTVQRIEYAADETRALVSVVNRSSASFSIFGSSAKFVVAGRQYESSYSGADYPEIASDLAPGASTSGVITFPAINNYRARTELYLEGSSDDYNLGDYGTVKWHFVWSGP